MVNGTLTCIRIAQLSKILVVDIKSDQPKFQFELNSTSVFNFSGVWIIKMISLYLPSDHVLLSQLFQEYMACTLFQNIPSNLDEMLYKEILHQNHFSNTNTIPSIYISRICFSDSIWLRVILSIPDLYQHLVPQL